MSCRHWVFSAIFLSVLGLAPGLAVAQETNKGAASAAPAAAASIGGAAGLGDPKSYVIGAEDILVVRVWKDNDLSAEAPVRPDGKITLQLLGDVQAAGLTPEALTQVIFDGLSKLKTLDRSEVTVTVRTVNSKRYYIQGEVLKPGPYPLVIPTTVLEALGNAGGFRDFAKKKDIIVMRAGGQRFKFNYKEVMGGKKREQNILLQSGDHIFVP